MKKFNGFLTKFAIPLLVLWFLFGLHPLLGWLGVLSIIGFLIFRSYPSILEAKAQRAYYLKGIDESIKLMQKATSGKKVRGHAKLQLAYLLLKADRLIEAEDILNDLILTSQSEEEKNYIEVINSLLLWKKGNIMSAIMNLKKLLESGYETTVLYGNLGFLLLVAKRYDEALLINKKALEFNDQDSTILDNLAYNYKLLGDFDEAKKYYEKTLEKNPNFPEPYYHFGRLLSSLGDKERAKELLETAKTKRITALTSFSLEDVEEALRAL